MAAPDNKVPPSSASSVWSYLAHLRQVREVNVLVAMLIVGALISLYTPYFLTTNNLMRVSRAFSLTAIMSIGMVIGAALVGVIANGIVLLNFNTYAQQAITGGVILIAVSLDVLRNRFSGGNS